MKKKYLQYISGFKGLLALIVLSHHFALLFYPVLVNGSGFTHYLANDLENKIILSPFNILGYGGGGAVSLFFIISGFLITYQFFYNKYNNKVVQEKFLGRYLYLQSIILISSIFAFLLGFLFNKLNLLNIPCISSISYYSNLLFSPLVLLYDCIIGTISRAVATFNPPLWTMSNELFGSCLVYIILCLFNNFKSRFLIYFILFLLFFHSPLVYFIIGLILADMFFHNFYIFKKKSNFIINFWLVILALYLFGYTYLNAYTPYYEFFGRFLNFNIGVDSVTVIRYLASTLIFIYILKSNIAQKIFSLKPFQVFGKFSLEFYVFHWVILYTVVWYVVNVLYMKYNVGYILSTFIGYLTFILITFLISYLYSKFVAPYVKKIQDYLINLIK